MVSDIEILNWLMNVDCYLLRCCPLGGCIAHTIIDTLTHTLTWDDYLQLTNIYGEHESIISWKLLFHMITAMSDLLVLSIIVFV